MGNALRLCRHWRLRRGDRLVFQLTLQPNGNYKFELYDQLDHDLGQGQNFDLQDDVPGDVYAIDFGKLIEVTDFDGDSVGLDGRLIIKVRDDVPEIDPVRSDRAHGR